jgi:hypothetical protein
VVITPVTNIHTPRRQRGLMPSKSREHASEAEFVNDIVDEANVRRKRDVEKANRCSPEVKTMTSIS